MKQVIPSKKQGALNQVWVQLSGEQQVGVIHVMAQLVLKTDRGAVRNQPKRGL